MNAVPHRPPPSLPWLGAFLCAMLLAAPLLAPAARADEPMAMDEMHHHDHGGPAMPPGDKNFSEFSHHLAGGFVLLMSAGEMSQALTLSAWQPLRLMLPVSMVGAGFYLLIWSDADAWLLPDGLIAPLIAGDMEVIQHKLYALLLLAVGVVEWFRRRGRLTPDAWRWPLPLFAIAGGALLLMHQHHVLTDMRLIQAHHRVMSVTAMLAGSAKMVPDLIRRPSVHEQDRWDLVWAILILLIGIELLLYQE